jgi:hypothetical protein
MLADIVTGFLLAADEKSSGSQKGEVVQTCYFWDGRIYARLLNQQHFTIASTCTNLETFEKNTISWNFRQV